MPFIIRPQGIVLCGPSIIGKQFPISKAAKPGTHVHVVFTELAAEQDVNNYAHEVMFSSGEADIKNFINNYYQTNSAFRAVFAKALNGQQYNDEVELLKLYSAPLLAIFGKEEKVLNPDYLDDSGLHLWQNRIHKIPEAGHLVNIDQPEALNQLLAAYARDVFGK